MTRIAFSPVKTKRTVRIQCSECGAPLRRVISAWQTVNPFNKNASGAVKTADNIYKENVAKLDEQERQMHRQGVLCQHCRDDI